MEKRKKKKHAAGRQALLQILLFCLCTGCGSGNLPSGDPSQEEQGAAERPGTAVGSLTQAPLLEWEDQEAENLAGMLQETCGGMMVRLEAGQYTGSGVICGTEENSLLVATAAHVLADAADGVKLTFYDGWETEEVSVSAAEQADLAVLRVPLTAVLQQRLGHYLAANLDRAASDRIRAGDGCIVMGSSGGVAEDAYEGVLLEAWIYAEDYGQYMVWAGAPGKPGMSGGGIFDQRGRLLGILSGYSGDGEWAAVPLAFLLEELSGGEKP